jgi:hypothetical protein
MMKKGYSWHPSNPTTIYAVEFRYDKNSYKISDNQVPKFVSECKD